MSWYKVGTITANNGSKIITGTGTQFTNPLNSVSAGRMLLLPAAGTVQIYEIDSVQSDTQLTLVSAYTGTTETGKAYAIPTSPSVSIEQFAHEFSSTLAYYQQQLSGWQQILTGAGNVTLTTPDGQTVTVRSQAAWDAALDVKVTGVKQTGPFDATAGSVMLNGAWGWGGSAREVALNDTQFLDWVKSSDTGSHLFFQTGGSSYAHPYSLNSLMKSTDTWASIAVGFSPTGVSSGIRVSSGTNDGSSLTNCELWTDKNLPNPATLNTSQVFTGLKTFRQNWESLAIINESLGQPSYITGRDYDGSVRWLIGNSDLNEDHLTLKNMKTGGVILLHNNKNIYVACDEFLINNGSAWTSKTLLNPNGKGFVSNAMSQQFEATGSVYAEFLKSMQSAGSCTVGEDWRCFFSVRHRGGNSISEDNADAGEWGWAIVDNKMTDANFNNFVLEKTHNGNWLPSVKIYHSGNVTVDGNGFLKAASPIVKLFRDGTSELSSEAEGVTTERISEGVYKISGCLGLNSDAIWGGVDGGIAIPRCRNELPRLWVDYGGDDGSEMINQDGSIVIRTYHRPHPDALAFARNEIEGYANGDPIDIPRDTFISVRVQMPEADASGQVTILPQHDEGRDVVSAE